MRPRLVTSQSTEDGIGLPRKFAAFMMLAGTAGLVVKEAISPWGVEWLLLAFAGVLTAAGVGITRRSLAPQVLARGAAWIVLLPSLLALGFSLTRGSMPPIELTGLVVGTGSALLLSRPMLHTKAALAAFNPKWFRRWFLAGSTASSATAMVTGGIALEAFHHHHWAFAAAFGALTMALLSSAIAVVRMRGWGIFLGALTSLILVLSTLFVGRAEAMALLLVAAPSLLMQILPVLVARMAAKSEATSSPNRHTRIDLSEEAEEEKPTFVRVAMHEVVDAGGSDEHAQVAVPARAAIRA